MSKVEEVGCLPVSGRLRGTPIVLVMLFALIWVSAPAQIVTGSITGTILDPSGSAVPGGAVTLVQISTGRQRHAETTERGEFLFSGLDGGQYNLSVSGKGFKTLEQREIMLATGERLPLGLIKLDIGSMTEVVSVTAHGGAVVQTQSAERAEVVTNSQISNLLLRGRNAMDLVGLLPGVVVPSESDDLTSTSNFNVLGNRQTFNNISIDGVSATDMGNGSMLKITVSQDAVSEVKILLSNYQAEYGRMAGSNIQIVTKSGTKVFHGLGSYFKRHEQFNAGNFFDNQNGIPKPRYRFNTWSYNLGGPVYIPRKFNRNRDKLFFFWHQEFWPSTSSVTGQVTMPTPLEKEGNFSQSVDLNNRLIVVNDPANRSLPFPGNIIPSSRIERSGQALLKFFYDPNFFDRSISRGQYNYVFGSENELPKRTDTLKTDYIINANNSLVGSYSIYKEDQTGLSGGVAQTANWPQMKRTYWSHSKSLTARYTRIIRPTVLNEFSFGFLSQPSGNSYQEEDLKRNQRDSVGFAVGQLSPGANPRNIVPNATFGGVPNPAAIYTEGRFPIFNRYYMFNWSDNLTIQHGKHAFKVGVYIETFFRTQKVAVNFNGAFDFGRNVNNPLDTNYAYANAILGVFNSYTETSGEALVHQRTGGSEFFVQDNWKVSRKLVLDYGLRMHYTLPYYETDNLMAGFVPGNYDPARAAALVRPGLDAQGKRTGVHPITGQVYTLAQIGAIAPGVGDPYDGMLLSGQDPKYPRALVNTRGIQWAPRFGFAYDVRGDGKTAVRGGFGAFYNRYFHGNFAGALTGQIPVVQNPTISFGDLRTMLQSSGFLFPTNVFGADVAGYLPMVMNYSLSVQRDVGHGTVVDVGYVGSLGRHLLWRRDINPIALGANFDPRNADRTLSGRPLPAAFLRPIQGYNNIVMMEGASSSNYHSLQMSAKRRFTTGVQFGLSWTWSKAMDFNDTDTESISTQVPLRIWNYGLASFDRTHIVKINYLWDLPAVRTGNPLVRRFLNGWHISGISSFTSGQPLGISFSTTSTLDITGSTSQAARVVVTGNPVLPKGERTFYRNFRTDVFSLPGVGTVGNAAKTVIRGPGINNWDIALFKSFPIREKVQVQFRWETYNTFNHTQFSGLDTGARFDPATSEQVNSRLGQFTAARASRQMQLALRLSF